MYGADWCGDCRRAKRVLERGGVDYEYIDLVAEPERVDEARSIGKATRIPVIVIPGGRVLVEPDDAELEGALQDAGALDSQRA